MIFFKNKSMIIILLLLSSINLSSYNNKFGVAQKKGDFHQTIEDNFHSDLNNGFFAVYDGHGFQGWWASTYLAENLHKNIIPSKNDSNIDSIIEKIFLDSHREIIMKSQSGSTAAVAIFNILNKTKYITAINIGDSRIVLSQSGKAIDLSVDHKPDLPKEREMLEKAGAFVWQNKNDVFRVYLPQGFVHGGIAMSRSLGDIDFADFLSHRPDIIKHEIVKNDEFVIIACDGLWDVMTSQKAVSFVKKELEKNNNDYEKVAKLLIGQAVTLHSHDDITVMIVDIQKILQKIEIV